MVWQSRSINLSRSDTYFSFNSVFAGANKFDYLDPGVKMHPTKTFVFAGAAPRDDKEKTANVAVEFSKTAPVMPFLQPVWSGVKPCARRVSWA